MIRFSVEIHWQYGDNKDFSSSSEDEASVARMQNVRG